MEGLALYKISDKMKVPSFVEKLGIDCYFYQNLCWQGDENRLSEAKCFILVDETVYSSADSFANLAQESGWATIVGYRTMGDGD